MALKRDSGQEPVKFYILSLYPSLLDRTHEFQAGRRAIEAVSALAGVELAITGIISDPGRHRIWEIIGSVRVVTWRSETSTTVSRGIIFLRRRSQWQ